MKPTTVAETLAHTVARFAGEGIEDSRLEAVVLLAHTAGITRTRLLAMLRAPLEPSVAGSFDELAERRLKHEPLAYITGHREFYGIDFECGPGALIPRPETELLVELALKACKTKGSTRIIDVGTGTGAIAIAVATHAPSADVVAIDASAEALAIARLNAERLGVAERVSFQQRDLLEGTDQFDIVLANLPYVAEAEWAELAPEVRDWEPREALVGGVHGTEIIERLLLETAGHLRSSGLLALEIGADQGTHLYAAARASFPEAEILVRTDLVGLDRVLVVRN